MVSIYARDLSKEIATDAFMGKGFEALVKKAQAEGKEVIVGEYFDKPRIE